MLREKDIKHFLAICLRLRVILTLLMCLLFFDDFFVNDQHIYLAFKEKTLD